jgi:hypothetical protein
VNVRLCEILEGNIKNKKGLVLNSLGNEDTLHILIVCHLYHVCRCLNNKFLMYMVKLYKTNVDTLQNNVTI